MSDTFYTPVDIAETNQNTNPPVGFQRLQAKPSGKLSVINSDGVETIIEAQIQTVLKVDGGAANTAFPSYVLRLDFGNNGANINPTGTP